MKQPKVADEVWIALALLHQNHPERYGFRSGEILKCAEALHPGLPCRSGVQAHISGHCIANRKPTPNTLRYSYRNADGTYRLYRDGDDYHPGREKGRVAPDDTSLPERHRSLVQWYWSEYNQRQGSEALRKEPPVRIDDLKVADEVWLALVLLHRENASRDSFSAQEIAAQAQKLHPGVPNRPGVMPHIYAHCVANVRPASGRYRMLYREPDGNLRLYRDNDDYHAAREGSKTTPQRAALPAEHRELHDWYFREYNVQRRDDNDPLMELVGLGADVWKRLGGGDKFIRWQRSDIPTQPLEGQAPSPKQHRRYRT
ncbi:MAG: hypothetical protein WD733_15200 [Bryobacterales bacterium]